MGNTTHRYVPVVSRAIFALQLIFVPPALFVPGHFAYASEETIPEDKKVSTSLPYKISLGEALTSLLPHKEIEISFRSEDLRGTMVTIFPSMAKWDQVREVLSGFDFAIVTRRAGDMNSIQRIMVLQKTSDSIRSAARLEAWKPALMKEQTVTAGGEQNKDRKLIDGEIPAAVFLERSFRQDAWLTNDADAMFQAMEKLAGRADIPNNSAGLPIFFVEPAHGDENEFSDYMGAYTQQMGIRDIQALNRILSVTDHAAGPIIDDKPK
jgi:hypothetical protein